MPTKKLSPFIKLESLAGLLLFGSALIALAIDNSPLHPYYQGLFATHISITFGQYTLSKPFLLWINDGLMTIFFMLVGMEIKQEILIGELNSLKKLALPGIAAVGGMIVPALIYVSFNWGHPAALRGWAIPAATDIAFSLGVLSLLGSCVPNSLKTLLTAIAIFDDLGIIIIIACFYVSDISLPLLLGAGLCLSILVLFNRYQVQHATPYLLIGICLWLFVLKSGVHATLAGVLLAFSIPLRNKKKLHHSLLKRMKNGLNPWVAYLILPLFALANAGVSFSQTTFKNLINPVSLGIALGLFVGKQIGILLLSWLATYFNLANKPDDTNWIHIYGISLLCGIGFTMSLFIGTLAFEGGGQIQHGIALRLGVLTGSLLSAITGYIILRTSLKRTPPSPSIP